MTGLVDYETALNPPKLPGPTAMRVIDVTSWLLPGIGAVLAIGAGVAALDRADAWAAWLGIAGGIAGAVGVYATNVASHVRDQWIKDAMNRGGLAMEMVEYTQRTTPGNFF